MSGLFTYQSIGTLAGAIAATTLVVQAIKGLPGVRRLSPRLLSFLVAFALLSLARIASGPVAWSLLPLLALNALLVGSSAIGTYQCAVALRPLRTPEN
jgi:hypothetical protein